jgi:hypothetical protein
MSAPGPTANVRMAQAIAAHGSSGPAGTTTPAPAIRAAAKQLSPIDPWDAKRFAPLLKAQASASRSAK